MNKLLQDRLDGRGKFQRCQVEKFVKFLRPSYSKILEIGCGKGFFAYVTARESKVGEVHGCDVYPDFQTKEISTVAGKVSYQAITSDTLPYPDNHFDLVLSMDVLEHLADDRKSISEHLRVCKPGGQIIIGTPNYFKLMNLLPFFLGLLKFPRSIGYDTYGDSIHIREYKRGDLESLLSENQDQIEAGSIRVIPCWFGIMALDIGISALPKFLEPFCQFWLLQFKKKKVKS